MIAEEIRRRTPDFRGLADIRLVTLDDGPGRGQRLLIARNAAGLAFEVAVDRGFDLAQLLVNGTNVGWHSPNQMRFPSADPDVEDGWGFFRNVDGFLVTCGLDHFGAPTIADISTLNHPHLNSARRPLHGRIATERARLSGYGIDENEASIWCEGIVRQTSVFGETLELRRRISVPLFESSVRIDDTVTNKGFRPTDHAILYHLNFGYPFLDEATTIAGLPAELSETFHAVDRRPDDGFGELVDIVPSRDLEKGGGVTVQNSSVGLQARLQYSATELPDLCIWRAYQSGLFALGIEPTSGNERQSLGAGQSRQYGLEITFAKI